MRDDSMSPVFSWFVARQMPYWGIFRFGGFLWIFAEVACSRIDDSMLFDLWPIIHFDAIQGHISVRMRFTDHEGVACLSLFARCMQGWWYIRYPRDDSLVEPIESHLASCRHRWFELIWFFDMLHFWCHTGAYSPSWSRFIDPHWFTWSSTVMRYTPGWWLISFCPDTPRSLSWLRSARFILFDIVVIPGWGYLRCLDFPRHHFRRVHIRSVTRPIGVVLGSSGQIGYIWCHTGAYCLHLALEAIVLSHIRYSFHHSIEIYCIRLTGHYSWALHRYELSTERRSRLVESLSAISSGLRFAAAYPHPWVYQAFCVLPHYSIHFLIFASRHTGAYPL